jgi:hypothetical protein
MVAGFTSESAAKLCGEGDVGVPISKLIHATGTFGGVPWLSSIETGATELTMFQALSKYSPLA